MGRNSKLEIRVKPEEYAQVKAIADKAGQSISDYCRALLGLTLSGQKGLVSVRTKESKPVRTGKQTLSGHDLSGQIKDTVRTEPKPAPKPKEPKPTVKTKEDPWVNRFSKEYMARKKK